MADREGLRKKNESNKNKISMTLKKRGGVEINKPVKLNITICVIMIISVCALFSIPAQASDLKKIVNDLKLDEIHGAISAGDNARVNLILKERPDSLTVTDLQGNTPLHFATVVGNATIIGHLVSLGANINMKNKDGVTPLHIAANNGNSTIIEILFSRGADLMPRDNNGDTPIVTAMVKGHLKAVEMLLSKGADPNVKYIGKGTLLHGAALQGQKDIAELLLKYGADINAHDGGKYNSTPLHLAAYAGKRNVVKLFLEKGADINAKDRDGDTPSKAAIAGRHFDIARMIERGK